MSVRRRDRFSTWIRGLRPQDKVSSGTSTPVPPSVPLHSEPPLSAPALSHVKSTSTANTAIDNLTVALGLVQQVADVVQRVPFIAPAAALMSEILKGYKEVKDTNEKRDILLANIIDLSCDICGAILRIEATHPGHPDFISRLMKDIQTYDRLLVKASIFIKEYDGRQTAIRVAARTELASKFIALNRELDSFGARFRTNRLVDLAINQNSNTQTLDKIHDMILEEKLEKWLRFPPDMGRKQVNTEDLRKEGTGIWLLRADEFVEWQDNPGSLWIKGPSGAGKSVLSSMVISELIKDKRLFRDLANRHPPAIAFFYFDFKDNEGQAMESALRRMILQLSAQSPNPYRALEEQYKLKSNGQTLPTYQELLKLLEELLLEIGRTYIIFDALDECKDTDLRRLLDAISTLRTWTRTPLHLLITSQPRNIFTEAFDGVPCLDLESGFTQKDIRLFVDSELLGMEIWARRAADRIVSKSNGMFRMAACLIVEISRCPWEDELDKTLDNLPNDLFGIYDRFLAAIPPEHFVYAEAVLRWLMFSGAHLTLEQLADAIAFNFSDPAHYTHKPSRREGNTLAIPKWFQGLVLLRDEYHGPLLHHDKPHRPVIVLAHASVQDYLLSRKFTEKFSWDLNANLSHTFIAQTCISYLLQFSDHSLDDNTLPNYPLADYVGKYWCHHLLHSHDRTILFSGAMRLLESDSQQYSALKRSMATADTPIPGSPLHLCSKAGYIEGVRGLLATGAEVNISTAEGSPWQVAYLAGQMDIMELLLENGAHVDQTAGSHASALQAMSSDGHVHLVRLLLKNGADVNAQGGGLGSTLYAASWTGNTEIIRMLLENGADPNAEFGEIGSPLQAASKHGYTEVARLLVENGANVNRHAPLPAASYNGHTEIVQLLLDNGADVNATSGEYGSPLKAARRRRQTDIIDLLLAKGAVNTKAAKSK